jgi:hypothetical protein
MRESSGLQGSASIVTRPLCRSDGPHRKRRDSRSRSCSAASDRRCSSASFFNPGSPPVERTGRAMMLTRSFTQSCSRVTSSAEYSRAASTSHRRLAARKASEGNPCRIFRHGARLPCMFATSSMSAQGSALPSVCGLRSLHCSDQSRSANTCACVLRYGRSSPCRFRPGCSLLSGPDIPAGGTAGPRRRSWRTSSTVG